MYNLTDEQIASVESFIGKIPDSIIKSRCEKWLAEVSPTQRATSEQMEQFVGFSTHLPQELQNFPQSFAAAVKNSPETNQREAKEGTTEPADLTYLADESIAHVADVIALEKTWLSDANYIFGIVNVDAKEGSKGVKKTSKTKAAPLKKK